MMSAAPAQQKATGSEIAREALDRIGALDDIERAINGQPAATRRKHPARTAAQAA